MTSAPRAAPAGRPAPASAPPSPRLLGPVLAFACGASVANIYYAQPLLDLIARAFGTSQGRATLVVALTQAGYALGLLLLLPLGDLLENRALASRTLVVTALALAGAALAPDLPVFLVASLVIGTTSVVAQVLVPLAAHLAPDAARGAFVGQVMGGLLLGIMLARSVASAAADAWGWRSIYAVSAVLMVVTSLALRRLLPARRPAPTSGGSSYPALLASSAALVREEPLLVRRSAAQACLFAAFTVFWTAITFQLVDALHLGAGGIALFALVGAGGALAAPVAGRVADRGWGRPARAAAIALALAAAVLAHLGAGSLVALAASAVVLDVAVQSHQVLNQRDIYALRPDARARVTSVYMTSTFAAGAAASALAGLVHERAGWSGATTAEAALAVVAALVWCADRPERGHSGH